MRRTSTRVGPSGRTSMRVRGKGGFGERWRKRADGAGTDTCPCGGGAENRPYRQCCAPYHRHEKAAETPLILLQTRFSAYAKGKVEYIVHTTHPDNPAQVGSVVDDKQLSTFQADVRATCKKVKFTDLKVLRVEMDGDEGVEEEAHVTFTCKATVTGQKGTRGKAETMQERSRFVRENGQWSYLDGEVKWT